MMKKKKFSDSGDVFDTPEYRRSRSAYCMHCAFEYLIALLVSDAFLAKLLSDLGFSDMLIGVTSSIISAAFLFQLSAVLLAQKIRRVKRFAVTLSALSQVLFVSLYLVPFLPVSAALKSTLVIVFLLLAYFCLYTMGPMLSKWGNSYVAPDNRGTYSAVKEMISLITGMAFTLAMGYVIDRYEGLGNLRGGFIFIAVAGLIVSICSFLCLKNISADTVDVTQQTVVPMKTVLRETLGNRRFIPVIVVSCLMSIASYMTVGFMGIYKTKTLMLSVAAVQMINIIGNLVRVLVSKPFGRFSDHHSFARGLEMGLFIAAAAYAFNIFAAPGSVWCIVAYTVLLSVSAAGTGQNSFNMLYSYVNKDYFVQAYAIKSSIGGIIGFLASLVGSKILGAVQSNGNTLFGMTVYGQQILSAISLLFAVFAALFTHFVICRQKVNRQ